MCKGPEQRGVLRIVRHQQGDAWLEQKRQGQGVGIVTGDEIMDTGQGRIVQGLVSSWQSILRAMGGVGGHWGILSSRGGSLLISGRVVLTTECRAAWRQVRVSAGGRLLQWPRQEMTVAGARVGRRRQVVLSSP